MDNTKLSQPWAIWCRALVALFEQDRDVEVQYDVHEPSAKVYVSDFEKANALARLIPSEVTFGNVTLSVAVIPANQEVTDTQLWETAFKNNDAFGAAYVSSMPDGSPVTFAMFVPECVQYFADDLTNPYGLQTRTYEQIARDVLCAGDVVITSDQM